jgi:flagellar motor protein MotB
MRHAEPEASGEKVPIWIISFADMITLLLAFFVMLQAMAKSRDNTLMRGVQRSFNLALARGGLPDFLFERQGRLNVDYRRLRYPDEAPPPPSEPAELPRVRSEDPKDEELDQAWRAVLRSLEAQTSPARAGRLAAHGLAARFAAGSDALDEAGETSVRQLARSLAADYGGHAIEVLVLAAAPEEADAPARWRLSALRAAAVEGVLTKALREAGAGEAISVRAWGCGEGAIFRDLLPNPAGLQTLAVVLAPSSN